MRPDRSPSPHSRHNGGREAQAVRRVRPQRPIALHEGDEPLGGQGGREGGAATSGADRAEVDAATAQPTPFSAVAPTITGSATVRESRFACSRVNRRARAAVSVARCATPRGSAPPPGRARARARRRARVARPAPLRPAIRRDHHQPLAASRPAAMLPGRRAGPRSGARARSPRSPAERTRARPRPPGRPVERGQLGGDHPALADQQRRRRPGVQRDLEALARLGVEPVPPPAREPGHQRQVRRTRDRQQLGRPLDGPRIAARRALRTGSARRHRIRGRLRPAASARPRRISQ